MASTSTNKQPLLIDRVFNEVVQTDGLVSGNDNTVTGASINYDVGGSNSSKVLVNCTTNDGGLVEDLYCISRGAAKTALFYLSSASDYLRNEQAVLVAILTSPATVGAGADIVSLPKVLAPVPQAGNITGLADGEPLRNQALYVPTGKALWVTIWGQAAQNATNCPIIGAQGGFF